MLLVKKMVQAAVKLKSALQALGVGLNLTIAPSGAVATHFVQCQEVLYSSYAEVLCRVQRETFVPLVLRKVPTADAAYSVIKYSRLEPIMSEYPQLQHTVIDTTDVRALAEFYRQLLGLQYRQGDEPPADGTADDADWLVLVDADGVRKLAFQQVQRLKPTTWPKDNVPMQMHLDFTVTSVQELERQRDLARSLGAKQLLDRSADPNELLFVFADPSGHPFCIFVA